jgi:hypothetical protein
VGRFKGKNESPCRKGGVPRGLPWSEVLSIFSGHSSISMLIRCAESSILVGCACDVLIGRALALIPSILLFLLPPFKVKGGHNGGFQGPSVLALLSNFS